MAPQADHLREVLFFAAEPTPEIRYEKNLQFTRKAKAKSSNELPDFIISKQQHCHQNHRLFRKGRRLLAQLPQTTVIQLHGTEKLTYRKLT